MSQTTGGFRKVLSSAAIYDAVQAALGSDRFRRRVVAEFLGPRPYLRVLDIGCGTGDMRDYLPRDVEYVGVDPSASYIAAARKRFGPRGSFRVDSVATLDVLSMPPFDVVLAIGVLHHLDDDEARHLFRLGSAALGGAGRMLTADPRCDVASGFVARLLISLDRGQRIRTLDEYAALARSAFRDVECQPRDDLLRVPYAHALMTCSTPTGAAGRMTQETVT
ncbi:MAG: class I SAM-dependent methyltransferase [Gemmatimonadetes bacterium]|nr:class I SAM-dependent methyltransferase [Gemmatimonadota bacterium]